MDKKTLIAITLSMMVLMVYQAIAPKKAVETPQQVVQEESQVVASKEVMNNIPSSPSPLSTTTPSPAVATEEIVTLENDNLRVDFTNIGGAIKQVTIKPYGDTLALTGILDISEYAGQQYTISSQSSNEISYSLLTGSLVITKTYHLNDGHTIGAEITLQNISAAAQTTLLAFNTFVIDARNVERGSYRQRDKTLMEYSISDESGIMRKGSAFKFSAKNLSRKSTAVHWIGYRDKYFCALVKPDFATKGYGVEPIDAQQIRLYMEAPQAVLQQDERISYRSQLVFAPQDRALLSQYGAGLEEISVFSNFMLLNAISTGISNLMKFIHGFIPSWGTCIILIALLVYGALSPLTLKSMGSMKRLQALQPQMAKIREQYKNNPQRLNKEMMELYKEQKVNPFGGCFPMLLQMPVFIALYQALWRSVMFKGASFLWIKDLSQPDRLIYPLPWPETVPVIGNEFNILPLLMVVVMHFQQKATSMNMASADPNQAAQQKMMSIIFPLVFGFIFYKFASGLNLYFTVFYILSFLTQLKMSKVKVALQ